MIDGGLRRLFHKNIGGVHWQTIETGGVGSGVPDTNACHRGREFWIEFKKTDAWAVGLNPEQVAWIHRRYRAGGRVWVAVRRAHEGGPRLGAAIDELWLVYGGHVMELAQDGLRLSSSLVTGIWRGGPSRWPWPEILSVLSGASRE